MLVVVVIIYAICWLPLHAITIAGDVHLTFYNLPGMNIVWTASHWLAMSNCMYNPFIYCWMNARFRNGFLKVIRVATCRFSNARNVIEMQHMHRHTSARFSSVGNRSNKSNFRSNSTTEYTCMPGRYSSGVLRDI
ncbi:hypothetical protein DPMN_032339 [Dreissena polymorpha]|uniref:G-protein coupled receptors family 1 profile domain-containing protein n=1 Tax=Dreissena polymorpha TaxID=45954 RepID=A0A9D4M411_DREPO|nr:hypothetical protein DPMN_032339 [Dreissena polymorpha]